MAPIQARDNIPVFSYLLLRGRCRHCKDPISIRYPMIEVLGALSLLTASLLSDSPVTAIYRAAFLLAMMVIVFIDLDHGIIPDIITIPGTIIGFAIAPSLGVSWINSGLGIVIGAGWLLLIFTVYRMVRGIDGMGGGDIKLAAMLGAWLGWQGMLTSLLIGSLIGTVFGFYIIWRHKGSGQTSLPYGPFLGPAAAAILLLGSRAWTWLP
jgi:leader peptidase (prepilin peptidase)/N-methyltransferase